MKYNLKMWSAREKVWPPLLYTKKWSQTGNPRSTSTTVCPDCATSKFFGDQLQPRVNFINILRENFLYERCFGNLHVRRKNCWKCWWNWHLVNIFLTYFADSLWLKYAKKIMYVLRFMLCVAARNQLLQNLSMNASKMWSKMFDKSIRIFFKPSIKPKAVKICKKN
jgi:hypothetical protein